MSELHPGPSRPMQNHEANGPYPSDNPTGTAAVLYRALQATARRAGAARGYVETTTHVTLHCPVDVVATALGRHRVTVWRAARRLQALGLVDNRPHKCTALDGRTVNDGTLWAVRLNPDEGSPARLTHEELTHEWRDLDRDRRRGRTAFRVVRERRAERLQQSDKPPTGEVDLELLAAWALPPQHPESPINNDCCTGSRRDLEAVLDVPHVAREDRAAMVDGAAQALSGALSDKRGLMFYRLLVWQLLRYADRTGQAPFYAVYLMAQRARVDAAEGFARRPGALFVSRLKQASWYDEVMRGPPTRVGSRPAAA